jgi:serine/threonine-protein kinase
MGEVYLAVDTGLNRLDAIKLPLEEHSGNAKVARRFERESKAMAKLRHENVCRIHHLAKYLERPFMAMEYIDGGPLSRYVGRLNLGTIAVLFAKIASAIDYAHGQGVVHRDLKPDNIMLDRWHQPIITDFGLARVVDCAPITEPWQILGTPHYMSPEQVKGDSAAIGPATDIFALGATLFELLTGKRPYEGESWISVCCKIVEGPAPKPSSIRTSISAEMDRICLKAMAKRPQERYPTAAAMAGELNQIIESSGVRLESASKAIPDSLSPSAVAATLVPIGIASP